MTAIVSDWADHYGGVARNFLYEQLRRLSRPEHAPGAAATIDPRTGHVAGADQYTVAEVQVGDRKRFDLLRVGGVALPLEPLPQHPSTIKTGIVHSDWASDFANKPENFLRHSVRWLHPTSSRGEGGAHVVGDTNAAGELVHAGRYYVGEVFVDGRLRYDLRPIADRSAQDIP
jgi:hypothetical protein